MRTPIENSIAQVECSRDLWSPMTSHDLERSRSRPETFGA